MEFHEVATIFPMMEDEEFDIFKQDIKENGLKEPIVIHEGRVIDGRNRYRACRELGVPPQYIEWDAKGSLVDFVVSLNLHRRHLTTTTKAFCGAKIADAHAKEAKERSLKNLVPFQDTESANLRNQGKSTEKAAVVSGASARSIEDAQYLVRHGSPELVAAAQANQVVVSTAAQIAKLPKDEQAKIVAAGPEAMVAKAAELREERKAPPLTQSKAPIATAGLSAVVKYLDARVDYWAKSREPHAEAVFAELQKVRKDLCGR